MVKALFDTNIIIDYLNAIPQARREFRRYTGKAISIITWMEVMVGADAGVAAATRGVLNRFDLVDLDLEIAEQAVKLRQTYRMKLPDAVIWASSQSRGMLLVTRNTKDFPAGDPGVRHPYTI